VVFGLDDELENGNPVHKGSAKPPEDGQWSKYGTPAWERVTVAACPVQIDDARLP